MKYKKKINFKFLANFTFNFREILVQNYCIPIFFKFGHLEISLLPLPFTTTVIENSNPEIFSTPPSPRRWATSGNSYATQ